MPIDLVTIQNDLWKWENKNFDTSNLLSLKMQLALGVCEEAGELAHAVLKHIQGIRNGISLDATKVQVVDAVGDIIIFATNLLSTFNLSLEETVKCTVEDVLKRNWKENKVDGSVPQ